MNEQRAHIVVVDDHKDIREPLSEYLEKHGFRATPAASGTELNQVINRSNVDLIVLDILMPGEGGIEICRRIRETRDIPVILLTAVTEEMERIIGLEMGADDYVTKPFNPRELLARIKGVLRRANSLPRQFAEMAPGMIMFDDWRLDVGQQKLRKTGCDKEVALSTVEFKLLMTFLAHPRIVLSRDQLLDMVSNRSSDVFDRSIDNQVSRLRKKIDPDVKDPKIIKTVWGGGYMLIVDVVKT